MDAIIKPPKNLSLEGNVAENWRIFNQRFDLFLEATDSTEETDSKKVALLLSLIGEEGLDLFNSFTFETGKDPKKLDDVKAKFEAYCSPKKNIIFERFVFNSIVQKEGQLFDNFLTELRKSVKTTEYSHPEDMIRDRIVIGIHDKSTQERLLRESSLTLEKAINLCRATEISKTQAKALQTECNISAVRGRVKAKDGKQCKWCGYSHEPKKCPAYNKTCAKCKGRNHFAQVCKAKGQPDRRQKKINECQQTDDSSEEEFYVSTVRKINSVQSSWTQGVVINKKKVIFKLDTGAEVSVMPLETLKTLGKHIKVKKTKVILVSYGDVDFKIKPIGEITLICNVGKKTENILFTIVDTNDQTPLLGLEACVKLNLIKRTDMINVEFGNLDQVVSQFHNVFHGLGKFPTKHNITLKSETVPKIQPFRRVPQTLHDKLKLKLQDMEAQGIIRKVDKPTDWINPLVIVEKKNSDLRLCLDPKALNESIKKEHFLIPTVDEISSRLNNKKYFTVLDMKDGYWQIELTDESADLCTFGTPFGRYQFLRLPFGIASAPEVFQRKCYEVFGDINGVGIYFDDLIITGETEEEHDNNLKNVLERASKYNLKFNKNKVQFKSQKVTFMGQEFSFRGVQPCQSYIKAILDMPLPNNRNDILRLLGMAKFLGKFNNNNNNNRFINSHN